VQEEWITLAKSIKYWWITSALRVILSAIAQWTLKAK
jgi:hypothetical protein